MTERPATPLQLPFVGRRAEAAAITSFWRSGFDAEELRALVVLGEAGIGKSRLVDVVLQRVVDEGGSVVHVRLYPDSTESLETLLRHALQMPGRGILPSVQSALDTSPHVVPALRRLVRLRATLLVVEDVHLLDAASAAELERTLAALATEPIAVVCLARPGAHPVLAALERCVVSQMTLGGLEPGDCAELWGLLSGAEVRAIARDAGAIAGELHRVSGGNPLAIRSALWGAIARGAIARNGADTGWRCVEEPEQVARMLERSVDLLSDGMTLGIGDEHLASARALALLGEVLSGDAAALLLDDAPAHIDALVAAGVLVPSTHVAVPLVGAATDERLAFAHSLVHARLARTATTDPRRLLATLASAPPVYSTHPFTWLAGHLTDDPETQPLSRMLELTLRGAVGLSNRGERNAALGLCRAAVALHERFGAALPDDRREEIEARLLWIDLLIVRRGDVAAQREAAREVLRRTQHPTSAAMAGARIRALARLMVLDLSLLVTNRTEIDALLERFPELAGTGAHIYAIKDLAHACGGQTHEEPFIDLERRTAALLRRDDLSIAAREELLAASAMLLFVFTLPDELERRLALLRTIESGSPDLVARAAPPHACMRIEIGELETAARLARGAIERARRIGASRAWQMELYLLYIRSIYMPADEVIVEAERHAATMDDPFWRDSLRPGIGMYLSQILLLRNEPALAADAAARFGYDPAAHPDRWVLLREAGLPVPDRDEIDWDGSAGRRMLDLLERYADDPHRGDVAWLAEELETCFAIERLHIWDRLLVVHAVGALVERSRAHDRGRLVAATSGILRDEVLAQLEWLVDPARRIVPFAEALLARFADIVGASSVARWRQRLGRVRREVTFVDERPAGGARVHVGMLGQVTIRDGALVERVQGARLRVLLATLVAGEIVERPLAQTELYRIAVGEEVERENARNIVKTTVRRLRDLLGDDAIDTDGETPKLDRSRVVVDLLEAIDELDRAGEALARGALVRGVAHMHAALETFDGEVPFPGCYGEFFEALRDELDVRLRESVLDAARALGREGDSAGAAALLEKGACALPGDEEVAELRARFLEASGRIVEARRVAVEEDL